MSDVSIRKANVNHKAAIQNQTERQELEIEKMKLAHQKRVQELRNQQREDLITINSMNADKLLTATHAHEEKLQAMQKSLEQTQNLTETEKKRLTSELEQAKMQQKQSLEIETQGRNLENSMALQDMDHQMRVELEKMQRKTELEKHKLNHQTHSDISNQSQVHQMQKESQKNTFMRTYQANEDKYHRQLQKQQMDNQKLLAQEERKNLNRLSSTEQIYAEKLDKLQQDREQKVLQKNLEFEKDFNTIQNNNRAIVQKVLAKREALINDLKQDLWQEYQLGIEMSKDPFYDFGKLESKVSESQDGKAYRVEIPAAPHSVDSIRMTAEGRNLKLMMDRRHQFTKKDDGKTDSMWKNESFVSTIGVKDIINPSTIKKSYQDGKVIFDIKKA